MQDGLRAAPQGGALVANVASEKHGARWRGCAAPLSMDAYDREARRLGCDPAMLIALVDVLGAPAFARRGRVTARFDPRLFDLETRGRYRLDFPDLSAERRRSWLDAPLSPGAAYQLIDAAAELDEDAALRATRWGLGRIHGHDHSAAGYDTPQAMVAAFMEGADAQLAALVNLLKELRLDGAMRFEDFDAVCSALGGPSASAERMRRGFCRVAGRAPFRALRPGSEGDAVLELQVRLQRGGREPRLRLDGVFGPRTRRAVERFQRSRGLVADGVVAGATWRALGAAAIPAITAPADRWPALRELAFWGAVALLGGAFALQILEELALGARATATLGVAPPAIWLGAAVLVTAALVATRLRGRF